LHPTEEGYQKIADTFFEVIGERLEERIASTSRRFSTAPWRR
jgi:hypothetical protein